MTEETGSSIALRALLERDDADRRIASKVVNQWRGSREIDLATLTAVYDFARWLIQHGVVTVRAYDLRTGAEEEMRHE